MKSTNQIGDHVIDTNFRFFLENIDKHLLLLRIKIGSLGNVKSTKQIGDHVLDTSFMLFLENIDQLLLLLRIKTFLSVVKAWFSLAT